jgi:hypothetical protein
MPIQLLRAVVDEQCAFHELAIVKAGENAFAPKIKMLGLKAFAPDDAFFLWPIGAHFPFAFSPRRLARGKWRSFRAVI